VSKKYSCLGFFLTPHGGKKPFRPSDWYRATLGKLSGAAIDLVLSRKFVSISGCYIVALYQNSNMATLGSSD
jgi:hypothetical protein